MLPNLPTFYFCGETWQMLWVSTFSFFKVSLPKTEIEHLDICLTGWNWATGLSSTDISTTRHTGRRVNWEVWKALRGPVLLLLLPSRSLIDQFGTKVRVVNTSMILNLILEFSTFPNNQTMLFFSRLHFHYSFMYAYPAPLKLHLINMKSSWWPNLFFFLGWLIPILCC